MLNLITWPLLISAVASIVVSLLLENARKPVLMIEGPHSLVVPFVDGDTPTGSGTSFRLRVRNARPSPFLSIFLQRQVARACRARLTFISRDGEPLAAPPMEGRWANSVQPAPLTGWVGENREKLVLFDHARFDAASRVDIGPGASEVLDVAVHFAGEDHLYGWTNSSYQYGGRHPDYALAVGLHVVEVTVESDGVSATQRISMVLGVPSSPVLNAGQLPGVSVLPLQAPVTESIARPST